MGYGGRNRGVVVVEQSNTLYGSPWCVRAMSQTQPNESGWFGIPLGGRCRGCLRTK
jgi:hypothetical protein